MRGYWQAMGFWCLLAITGSAAAQAPVTGSPSVGDLQKSLQSGDAEEQALALEAVGRLGTRGISLVPHILPLLSSQDPYLRYEAATALGNLGPEASEAVPALTNALSDETSLVQHAALDALRKLGDAAKAAREAIQMKTTKADPGVQVAALRALYRLGDERPEVVTKLVHALAAPQASVRSEARWALLDIGPSAIPEILNQLKSDSCDCQIAALDVLAEFGPLSKEACHAIPDLLKAESPELRRHAALLALQIGTVDAGCQQALLTATTDKDTSVQQAALMALGVCGTPQQALPVLRKALKSPQPALRLAAVDALAGFGPDAAPAVPEILALLKDEQGLVSLHAAEALTQIGAPAVASIVPLLKDAEYQPLALHMLDQIGPGATTAVSELVALLKSTSDEMTKRQICLVLADLKVDAAPALPELQKILMGKMGIDRPAAAYALGSIGTEPALKEIARWSDDADPLVRIAVAAAQLRAHPEDRAIRSAALPKLREALQRPEPNVRRMAAQAAALFGPEAAPALPELLAIVKSDQEDLMVREAALGALGELGTAAAPAISELVELHQKGQPELRLITTYTLGRLGPVAKPAVAELQRQLAAGPPLERAVAAWALAEIDPTPENLKTAVPVLLEALITPRETAAVQIIQTLRKVAGNQPEVRQALTSLVNDRRPAVQAAARSALGE